MSARRQSHIDSPHALGTRLREARRAAGLRQADLVFPGCSGGYVSLLEAGRRIPSLQVVRELARRLGVSEEWLATGVTAHRSDEDVRLEEAELALRLGDSDGARATFTALAASAAPRVRARAEAGLGQLAFVGDHAHEAIEHLEAAYRIDPELDDPSAADTLGRAYARVGEEELAVAIFRRELERARAGEDVTNVARFSVLLANALIDSGRFTEAATLLAELAQSNPRDPLELARIYWSQSRLHALRGETQSAARFARKTLGILEATEHRLYTARAYQMLAYVQLDSGEAEQALETIERGRQLLAAGGTEYDDTTYDLEEARARALLGDLDTAARLAMRSSGGYHDGNPKDTGRSYAELAAVFAARGDDARALELYELAIELLEGEPTTRWLVEAYVGYAGVLESRGRRDDAFAAYKQAAQLRAALVRPKRG